MDFSQKIYYFDKPLVLTTDAEAYITGNPAAEHYLVLSGATLKNFNQAFQHLDRPGSTGMIIEDFSLEALQEQLYAMYTPIDAAGGLVHNEQNEILMIFRRGKWDLPKGKLDAGESIDECSLREVREETGLEHLALEQKICDTYHVYTQGSENLLKRTAWFKMKGLSADKLKPQKEEDIVEAKWVAESELASYAARSYEAIRDVLGAGGLKWEAEQKVERQSSQASKLP
jgi:ADP-ribose pyrophosphatase YjhB (NUDIX family)